MSYSAAQLLSTPIRRGTLRSVGLPPSEGLRNGAASAQGGCSAGFTPPFEQDQLGRTSRQELTIAELTSERAVAPQLIRQWQRLGSEGSTGAVTANEAVVPLSELRLARARIMEQRAGWGRGIEIEILQAVTGRPMTLICWTFGISRACAYRESAGRPRSMSARRTSR